MDKKTNDRAPINADGRSNYASAEALRGIFDPDNYKVDDLGDGSVRVTCRQGGSHRVMQSAPLTDALAFIFQKIHFPSPASVH